MAREIVWSHPNSPYGACILAVKSYRQTWKDTRYLWFLVPFWNRLYQTCGSMQYVMFKGGTNGLDGLWIMPVRNISCTSKFPGRTPLPKAGLRKSCWRLSWETQVQTIMIQMWSFGLPWAPSRTFRNTEIQSYRSCSWYHGRTRQGWHCCSIVVWGRWYNSISWELQMNDTSFI